MLAGDVLFLAGRAETGLMAALYSIVLLYVLKGGVFVPVFTGNHLRATGRGDQAPFLLPLEFAAVGAVVALAAADLAGAPPRWRAAAALLAFAVHAVRLAALAGLEGAATPRCCGRCTSATRGWCSRSCCTASPTSASKAPDARGCTRSPSARWGR